jgi:hypothetical protein
MKIAIATILMAAAAFPAGATPLVLQIGRIGEVQAEETSGPKPPLPGNMAGMSEVDSPRYMRLGPDITGTYCKQFGLEFRAANLPPGVTAPVMVQLQHPQWTGPNGQTSTTELNPGMVSGDHWSYAGYTLEEDWSLVPGTWTFTITQGPRILATTSFNVSVEPGQHMPATGCSTPTS